MRYAFVKTLMEEAGRNKNIMLITADLGFTVFEEFEKKYPERFINVGVAEQNMIGIATGLAMTGKIVFAYSIATFVTMRAFEQIRHNVASHNASVIIVGSGAGLSYGHASITHHAVEDISLMRGIHGMTILCPADPMETIWATKISAKLKRPVYLRLGKKGEPLLHKKNTKFRIGKGIVMKKGKDIVILTTGNIVANTIEAAKLLKRRGIDATLVSMHTIKPIDTNLVKKISNSFPLIIAIEEHNVIGGLGSAVSEILSEQKNNTQLLRIGVPDNFIFHNGSHVFLRGEIGLNPNQIARKIYTVYNKLK